MNPKHFPSEKLDLIAHKAPEDLHNFLSAIPTNERARLLPPTPGFRQNSAKGVEESLRRFIHDLRAPSGLAHEKALSLWPRLWRSWVIAHAKLNEVLEEFDNSADFTEVEGGAPPNTNLDISCFEFLLQASRAGRIDREEISAFYDFGYFLPEDRIERLIAETRPESDIALLQRLESLPETVTELRGQIQRLVGEVAVDASQVTKLRSDLTKQAHALQDLGAAATSVANGLEVRIATLEADKTHAHFRAELQGLNRTLQGANTTIKALGERLQRLETASQDNVHSIKALSDRLTELTAHVDRAVKELSNAIDKQVSSYKPSPSFSGERDLLEIEECSDPAAVVLSTIEETTSCLVENLRAVGLNVASARSLSREVLAGLHAGQIIMFSGSAAGLVADACAATLGGRCHLRVHIPIGLLDGIEVGRLLSNAAVRAESDGLFLVVLEGINRSAPEAYADHLRALFHRRLFNPQDGLLFIGTLLDGPSTLPIAPNLCEMGPIFDTDVMLWADTAHYRPLSTSRLSPDSWQVWHSMPIEEVESENAWSELSSACEGAPDVTWRQATRRAYRGLIAAGAGDQFMASLSFGWLLPRAVSAAVPLDGPVRSLIQQLSDQDKRIKKLLLVHGLASNDD